MSNPTTKWGRDYLLTIGVGPYGPPQTTGAGPIARATQSVTIKPPFALEFDIRREFAASSQTATIKIRNLASKTRDVIYKDPFSVGFYAEVKLQAGYKGQYLPTIFQGTILQAQSRRENQKYIVTEIQAFDGGFAIANSYTALALGPSQSYTQFLTALNGDLYGVSGTPVIGTVPKQFSIRSSIHVGPTFELIQRSLPVGIAATIDSNRLLVLADTDALDPGRGTFYVVESKTGLLDPPVREGFGVKCRMLFEPRVSLGQYVVLNSEDNPMFNGDYQVKGISHRGIISPSDNGPAETLLEIYNFGKINALTGKLVPQ